jgi:hypothetical protein
MSTSRVRELSKELKLEGNTILRLNDMIIQVRMGGRKLDELVQREFRLSVKRRLYLKCVRIYPELFKNKDKGAARQKGLNEPYIWNDLLEEDQFALHTA